MTNANDLLALLANPWNGVLIVCLWSAIQALKKSAPSFFDDGGAGHHVMRPISVGAGAIAYLVPGPWIEPDVEVGVKIAVGLLMGTVTTLGHGLMRDAFKLVKMAFTRRLAKGNVQGVAKDASSILNLGKKLIPVLVAVGAGGSGVYGAWLKPETGAQKAYEVHAAGIEQVSGDVEKLRLALTGSRDELTEFKNSFNNHDKYAAVELALLKQSLANLEAFARGWGGYRPKRASVSTGDLSLSFSPENVNGDEIEKLISGSVSVQQASNAPAITREGGKIKMPERSEVFK